MVITNGFTYIAFLMCLAGCLLLLEKYSKWRIFNVVPALVFIYILNMIFVLWDFSIQKPVQKHIVY